MSLYVLRGLEYFDESELVDNRDMIAKGFKIYDAAGNRSANGRNATAYFDNQELGVIYAECYIAKREQFLKLIIDRHLFESYGLRNKAISLNTGKGDGKRCVPSVSRNRTTVALHRLFEIKEDIDHSMHSLNIITRENVRGASTLLNNKNKLQVDAIKVLSTGEFMISFSENKKLLTNVEINELKKMGYSVNIKKRIEIRKCFDTKVESLKAIREYEEKFYKEFAYSVIYDLSGRFDLAFQQYILRTMTEDDVIKTILKDYANDACSVYRYNLIPLFEKYDMPFNKGITLPNGDLVNC